MHELHLQLVQAVVKRPTFSIRLLVRTLHKILQIRRRRQLLVLLARHFWGLFDRVIHSRCEAEVRKYSVGWIFLRLVLVVHDLLSLHLILELSFQEFYLKL